jgi:hypothetical protein
MKEEEGSAAHFPVSDNLKSNANRSAVYSCPNSMSFGLSRTHSARRVLAAARMVIIIIVFIIITM